MVAANLDAKNLKDVDFQGQIHEDVMDKIWDISKIPLPLTDMLGSGTHGNDYTSWTTDQLGDPALGGWVDDGADSDQNDTATGNRIGNHSGILTKEVRVSSRARASNTIGFSDALAYQVMMRQQELRRNVEANSMGNQGSTESDPENTIPGVPASIPVQMEKFATGGGGTGGVFSAGIRTAWTPGTKAALTETMLRDACQAAWEDGGNPGYFMSVPSLIRRLSE